MRIFAKPSINLIEVTLRRFGIALIKLLVARRTFIPYAIKFQADGLCLMTVRQLVNIDHDVLPSVFEFFLFCAHGAEFPPASSSVGGFAE